MLAREGGKSAGVMDFSWCSDDGSSARHDDAGGGEPATVRHGKHTGHGHAVFYST